MALDGIFLHSIIQELKDTLLGGKVDKINQPEKDEIVLYIRNNKNNYKLCISASPVYPKIHLTDLQKTNPMQPPMYCMVLRKYLTSAKIVDIYQLDTDRVMFIDFESSDELGFNSIYTLVIEIMGRHSNITLIRKRDNIIMDSIKHITEEINSIRSLFPGIKYIYPPASNKLNPFDFSFNEFSSFIAKNNLQFDKNLFSKVFTGVSSTLSKEITYRLDNFKILLNMENLERIYEFLNEEFFSKLKNNNFFFSSYSFNGDLKDFYCIELLELTNCSKKEFSSPSKLIQDYFFEKDKKDRLNNKSSILHKLVLLNIERCLKKIDILKNTLDECNEKESLRMYGELLTANIYNIKQNMDEIEVLNYYSENGEYITIKIDKNKSASENIQSYFKKYNKLKKSEESAIVQLQLAKEELEYLQSVITNLENAEDYEAIEDIKNELIETGYIKYKKSKDKKTKSSKPMHFVSSDGIDIYVGKNNIQNDFLTLKFADKHNIWLHTKNIPGSHVIIKTFGDVPESTLNEAANLAAYYSKGSESSKVPVDYTEVRNVKKPSGAKPGMVIYYTNKTIYITPEKTNLKQLK